MEIKFLPWAATALGFALSCSAHAAVITHGNLVSDSATDFITDTVSGREYKRFDAFDYTYAQTLAAIASGGIYEGWSIATESVADEFIRSALGVTTTPCDGYTPPAPGVICGVLSGWSDGDFGLSHYGYLDTFAYILDAVPQIGFVQITTSDVAQFLFGANLMASDGFTRPNSINYLLYKNASGAAVPEPSLTLLMASGLLLLGITRRKSRV